YGTAATAAGAVDVDLIEAARRGDLERLHAARECALRVGLEHEVHVVGLDARMNDAEVRAREHDEERLAKRAVGVAAAHAANVGCDAQRDEDSLVRSNLAALAVRLALALVDLLAACALALAAPGAEHELLLDVTLANARHG